jgi:hypothetical protein
MIFQNHPAFAELRPGMGYAPGARNFGYAPGARNFGDMHHAHLGDVAHMGYAPGARGLGAMSDSMKNLAIDDGINTNDIDLLDSLGATDQDMTDLVNGNISLTALYAKYGVTIPSGSTATAAAQGAATTPASVSVLSTPSAQVPSGSELLYVASWTAGAGNLSVTPNAAISSLGSALAAHGMSVMSGEATSSGPIHYGIQVMILDSVGHALQADAQSVVHNLMLQIVGNNLTGDNLSIAATPSQGTTSAATPASNPLTWLENNALYLGLGVGALVLLNNFTGKKRR